jgi:hypothetical protein
MPETDINLLTDYQAKNLFFTSGEVRTSMRSPHQQILVLSWPFWTIEKTKDLGRSAEEKLNPVPVAIFFTGFNCSLQYGRFYNIRKSPIYTANLADANKAVA